MKRINYPDVISAPVEKIHYCPICGRPYLEEPVGSMIIDWMNVCPDCACQEKDIYPYVFNYMRFLND